MRVPEFLQSLTKNKPPLVVLLGTESALQQQALDALKALIPESEATMNFATYDMRQTPVAVALDDAASPPFFGDYREVVIQDPYFLTGEKATSKIVHDLDALTAYFKAPVDSTIMVLVASYAKLDERKRLTKALKKNQRWSLTWRHLMNVRQKLRSLMRYANKKNQRHARWHRDFGTA